MAENEMIVKDEKPTLATMGDSGALVTSFDKTSREGGIKAFNASQNALPLQDHINEVIDLKDVIMQNVEVTDEQTGEITPAVRTVLIASDGTSYSATSRGLTNSLHQIFALLGVPQTWQKPLKVKVLQKQSRTNPLYHFLTLAIAEGEGKTSVKK